MKHNSQENEANSQRDVHHILGDIASWLCAIIAVDEACYEAHQSSEHQDNGNENAACQQ